MKNWYIILAVLIGLFVLIYWDKIKGFISDKMNVVPADGGPCVTTTGAEGIYSNGACIPNADGGPGGPDEGSSEKTTERYASGNTEKTPDLLLNIPMKACIRYSVDNPFTRDGMNYRYAGKSLISGRNYCRLKRVY